MRVPVLYGAIGMKKLKEQPRPGAGYLFALLLSLILFRSQFNIHYSHEGGAETLKVDLEQPDKTLLIYLLPLIALSLGVEIDKKALIKVAAKTLKIEDDTDDTDSGISEESKRDGED